MELAIQSVLPETTHRWCKWHVLQKAKESLGVIYGKKSDFKNEFHKIVHHMITTEEFESGWDLMISKYSLEKHPFLTQIYEVRHMWAKPYFKGVFCARMTSTQRSESANHLLKSYVPPSCPMHLFVRQFQKLQHDRHSAECYEEKRTSLAGIVFRMNLPIERHASKVYTRAMFEHFGEALFKSGAYELQDIEDGRIFLAEHVDAASREKWCKLAYRVEVEESLSFFNCECGMFEHSGMICCHALKVMVHLKLRAIPERHIVKRWTKNARDVLPDKLLRYQKDQGPPKASSFRHTRLYIKALECVQLGDSNVQCYGVCIAMLGEIAAKLAPLSAEKDGMSLVDREAADARMGNDLCDNNVEGDANLSGDSNFKVPGKNQKRGRPTTSRDKPPYEESKKRSRFCTICRGEGHKSTTCPMRCDLPKPPRKLPKCSRCGVLGDRKNVCENPAKPWEVPFL